MYHYCLKEFLKMKKNRLSIITLLVSTAMMMACTNTVSSSNSQTSQSSGSNSESTSVNSSNITSGVTSNDETSSPVSSASASSNHYEDGSSSSSTPSLSSSEISSSINSDSSSVNPNSSSSGDNTSSSSGNGGSSSSQPIEIEETLDDIIADFIYDFTVVIPSVNAYDLFYDVVYYYAYEQYMIIAQGYDLDGAILTDFANECLKEDETGLISQNDEEDDPLEDGYLFSDETGYLLISFYNDEGIFNLVITRNDGLSGALDVSDVDTNWYVDYVNFQGMVLVSSFPEDVIKEYLEFDNSLVLPAINVSECLISFEEGYEDEDGYYPDTFYVVLQDDNLSSCITLLSLAGFEAELIENTSVTIDWDTWDLIEYTYYTGVAYNIEKNVYVELSLDDYDNTLISFYRFDDLFVADKTTDNDWSDEEKVLMNSTLGQVMPFMQFGENYSIVAEVDEYDYTLLSLQDSYYVDLTEDYIDLLLANGFEEDSDTYLSTCYVLDNGSSYIEVFVEYYYGNYVSIYYEPSKLPNLTSLKLNETTLDIVAGASFQLKATYEPSDATHLLTWTSSNDELATVDNNGLVSINANASVNSSVTITASAVNGVSASCTFNIKENKATGVCFVDDIYSLIPGGDKVQTNYYLLPCGATSEGLVSYSVNPDTANVFCDVDGKLWANSDAVEGTTVEVKITIEGVGEATATVKVVSASVKHTLTSEFFGIKDGESRYDTYKKITDDGASYEAQAAATHGLQIRNKNEDSGVIGYCEGRTCQSITFTFDSNTYSQRKIDIYASNSPFTIEDMYDSSFAPVGTITYQQGDEDSKTQTYTFTEKYSYIGFRSDDGAIYLTSVDIVW